MWDSFCLPESAFGIGSGGKYNGVRRRSRSKEISSPDLQPADYDPTPLELMPIEQPIPPPGFLEEEPGEEPPAASETGEETQPG